MFSERQAIGGLRHYSREFFESLIADLSRAGFQKIDIILPHNLVPVKEHIVTPRQFLDRERNYPSLILRARNARKKETLKILFINRDTKSTFFDDTFPSGESEPPSLYFQSPDPARTYAMFHFFYDYLTKPGTAGLGWLGAIIFGLVLATEVISLLGLRTGIIAFKWGQSPFWDVVLSAIALIVLFRYFASPRGVWVKPTRELRIIQLANMAIRGELRDNPLVSLAVIIVGTIVATVIMKLLGVI